MKIAALVRSGESKDIVLDEKPKMTYYRSGGMLIGMDDTCTFLDLLYYQNDPHSKAFAGYEFDITLDTGEVVHCNGQWWHGGVEKAEKLIGEKIVHVGYKSVDELKKCYVFTGGFAIRDNLKELLQSYTGQVWEYWDYEKCLAGVKQFEH
ncbi:hypothetical protein H6F38_04765 [Paenibacillus sp. EKM208P]|nr:hypothetical protein H6F38_04765 [Paenibacillus sp. EKM208P]